MRKVILVFGIVLGSINLSAQTLVPCSEIDQTTKLKRWGFCDSLTMKQVVKCQFDSAFKFSNGLARVVKNRKTGYVNSAGKVAIPMNYDDGFDFNDGFAFVGKDNQYFYINKSGVNQFKRIYSPPPSGIKVEELSESARKIYEGQLYEFKKAHSFSEGLAVFMDTVAKKFGYIDTKGAFVIPAKYIYAKPFSEGLAFVKESPVSPLSCINKKGENQFTFPDGTNPLPAGFKNGFVIVLSESGYNYIKKDGKLLLPEPVTRAEPFVDGFAIIYKNEEARLINTSGVDVLKQPFKYLGFSSIKNILYYSNNTKRGYGLTDITGKRRTKAKYEDFTKLNDTLFLCRPWGSSVYTLLSVNNGELIYSWFTAYSWIVPKTIIRLEGLDLFEKFISLDYNVKTGKFLKDGKELAAKDNIYLKTAEERRKDEGEMTGVIKYENASFTLSFPIEMEVYKDSVDYTVYRNSTYFFSIKKRKFGGAAAEYLFSLKNNLQSEGKYEKVEEKKIVTGSGTYSYLEVLTKKSSDNHISKVMYMVLDAGKENASESKYTYSNGQIILNEKKNTVPGNSLYVITATYFITDENVHGSHFIQTIQSVKWK